MVDFRIVASFAVMGIVASMIGFGSYAYFNGDLSGGITMTADTLNLVLNGVDPFPDQSYVVRISDMKPSLTRVGEPTKVEVQYGPGKLYKMISNVQCNQGRSSEPEIAEEGSNPKYDLDSYTWFDLSINGMVTIPDGTVTVSEIEDKWIYLGCYEPWQNQTVVQSFHLGAGVTNWAQGDSCTFTEAFAVTEVDDTDFIECFNDCKVCAPGAIGCVEPVCQVE